MEALSKDRHPVLDAGSPKKAILIIRGLRVEPAMTNCLLGLLRQLQALWNLFFYRKIIPNGI